MSLSIRRMLVIMMAVSGIFVGIVPSLAGEAVTLIGKGPVGGTNFGWGDRSLKMTVSASTNSGSPVPVRIECYWVFRDRSRHGIALADRRVTTLTSAAPLNYEVVSIAQRNNGATAGIVPGVPNGPYRGWLVVGYDAEGKIFSASANMPEFQKLAPEADSRPMGIEASPTGLNPRPATTAPRSSGGLSTGRL